MTAIRFWARTEPAIVNAIVTLGIAVLAALGTDVDANTVWAILAALGLSTVATRRKVVPVSDLLSGH